MFVPFDGTPGLGGALVNVVGLAAGFLTVNFCHTEFDELELVVGVWHPARPSTAMVARALAVFVNCMIDSPLYSGLNGKCGIGRRLSGQAGAAFLLETGSFARARDKTWRNDETKNVLVEYSDGDRLERHSIWKIR